MTVVVAGVVNRRNAASAPLLEWPRSVQETRLVSCEEAIAVARHSPYWQNQSWPDRFAVDCRVAPAGWRLTASVAVPKKLCELYVGRDRLIVPRLPCQGVGEHDSL